MNNLQQLIDDANCYAVFRALRWPDGVRCVECRSGTVKKRGFYMQQVHRQRYQCQAGGNLPIKAKALATLISTP